jgi:putative tryptophan/tyrosine transport system substrate-binding protein
MLFALYVPVHAQQQKKPRIGYQSASSSGENNEEAFRQGLRELGYVEGQDIVIERRFAQGKPDQVRRNAAELVRLKVEVIVTGGAADTRAAKGATTAIPIVMTNEGDPVGTGLVASLARPGGNVTGLASLSNELRGKLLELLKEILPQHSHVFALHGPGTPSTAMSLNETEVTARSLGLKLLLNHLVLTDCDKPCVNSGTWRGKTLWHCSSMGHYGSTTGVINLKAAEQIGLTIPPNMLARADKVIK